MTMSSIRECVRCGGAVTPEGTCSVCGTNNGRIESYSQPNDYFNAQNTQPPPASQAGVGAEGRSADVLSFPSREQRREAPRQPRPAFLYNKATGERFQLSQSVSKIGRDQTNNISVTNDHYISRHHAWVLQMQGGYWVEDLGSTNGTFLNGDVLSERRQIFAGDRITFGKTELVFAVE
jgi:hypothetical protein